MKRKDEGITLVALVVTIIVLLILAAVSMNFVLGQNGIITRSKQASEKTREAQKQENKDLDNLESEIGQFAEVTKTTDKQPGVISGSGSEQDPCLIESIEDLVKLQKDVDAGNYYEGKEIKLAASLDFNSDLSYVDPNSTSFGDANGDGTVEGLKKELTRSKGWTPIGTFQNGLKGDFNGNGKQILNVYMNRLSNERQAENASSYGLFGRTDGKVSNLSLSGNIKIEYKLSANNSCVNVSALGINDSKIEKVTNNINIEIVQLDNSTYASASYVGGISCDMHEATDCINNGNINITTENPNMNVLFYLGGICGIENGGITNTINNGSIKFKNVTTTVLGGIVGMNYNGNIENVINKGNFSGNIIHANMESDVGGIVGNNYGVINKAINTGKIAVKKENYASEPNFIFPAAGIVGRMNYGKVLNSINEGEVSITFESNRPEFVGGIVGIAKSGSTGQPWSIENVLNRGKVIIKDTSTSTDSMHFGDFGGILGASHLAANVASQNCKIKNAYNEGNVEASYGVDSQVSIGGIFGYNETNAKAKIDFTNIMDKGDINIADQYAIRRGFLSGCGNATSVASSNGTFIDNSLSYTGPKNSGLPADSAATRIDMTPENVANQMNSGLEEGYCRWKNDNGKVSLDF